jgi:glycosyltransferase involved in cell wall biosynthesis
LKIAIIGSKGLPAKYGGVQTVVEKVAPILVSMEHEVTVYGRYHYTKKKQFNYKGVNSINHRGIKTKRLDTISHVLLSTIAATYKRYDVVVFHSHVPGIFAIIPKIFGLKTIVHVHGIFSAVKHYGKWNALDTLMLKALIKLSRWAINEITTDSLSQKKLTEEFYNRAIDVIPNGVTLSPSDKTVSRNDYFLYVGRIIRGKGLETLIKGFNKYSEVYPNARLKIVGAQVHSSDFVLELKALGGHNNSITYEGFKSGEDLRNLYKEAFAVVIPSEAEAFGLVLLEALAYNGVVLTSDLEQFILMADGFIETFKSKNSESLFDQLLKLTIDKNLHQNLLSKSEQFNYNLYNWENITLEYQKLYIEVLNNRSSKGKIN